MGRLGTSSSCLTNHLIGHQLITPAIQQTGYNSSLLHLITRKHFGALDSTLLKCESAGTLTVAKTPLGGCCNGDVSWVTTDSMALETYRWSVSISGGEALKVVLSHGN